MSFDIVVGKSLWAGHGSRVVERLSRTEKNSPSLAG